ncbi:MAG: RNA methyltransferase [Nitrospirota bacterium]|nr:RNA methyltransferase [Nitrospirota bacterium]
MVRWKDNISFVLVETMESGNIGASARALKNLGFSRLELISPAKFPSEEAGWFAHGAEDILAQTKVYPELTAALSGKSVVIGTTRRPGKKRGLVYPVRDAVKNIRSLSKHNRIALLFGREDRGLTNEETAACSFMIRIPASPENPSFNLAQAVLLIAYELSYGDHSVAPAAAIISNKELSCLFERLKTTMKMAGYQAKGIRYSEEYIMTDLKRLIARTGITEREARMLHGIISQVEGSLMKIQCR